MTDEGIVETSSNPVKQSPCPCRRPPFHFADYDTVQLGEDPHGAEISLSACKRCGTVWLEYLIEEPQHSRSGRWWRVEVPPENKRKVSANAAREFIELQPQGFGGSYFNSQGHAVVGPIHVA